MSYVRAGINLLTLEVKFWFFQFPTTVARTSLSCHSRLRELLSCHWVGSFVFCRSIKADYLKGEIFERDILSLEELCCSWVDFALDNFVVRDLKPEVESHKLELTATEERFSQTECSLLGRTFGCVYAWTSWRSSLPAPWSWTWASDRWLILCQVFMHNSVACSVRAGFIWGCRFFETRNMWKTGQNRSCTREQSSKYRACPFRVWWSEPVSR